MLEMNLKCLIIGLILGLLSCSSEAVRMVLEPTNVVIGGGSYLPTPIPTASSQQYLTMECTPESTGSIESIYSLYMKRKRSQDFDYTTFAILEAHSNSARLMDNAPQDIRTKNPLLDGQINNNNVYSSVLRVRFQISSLDCLDEASYQCEMNYRPVNMDSTKDSNIQNLIVTVLPGNIAIQGAQFDGFFANPIQNRTFLQAGSQYELTCSGDIGTSQATLIEWYRMVPPYLLRNFQPVTLTSLTDNIDNGVPSTTVCPYSRTSKLRYTVVTNQIEDFIVRCHSSVQKSNGEMVTAVSEEFHLTSSYTSTASTMVLQTTYVFVILGVFMT